MKPNIDPTVDCVFKAILGAPGNENLLIHFLNAVLNPPPSRRIVTVELLNPFNLKESRFDKLSIVDVKARDEQGTIHQIEMQMVAYPSLKARMLYGWATLYASQLKEGDEYGNLRPVISIWLMVETVFHQARPQHLHFEVVDRKRGLVFGDHFGLHVLQLKMWQGQRVRDELDRWTRFFLEGVGLDTEHLPEWMKTGEMEQAMGVLRQFSEKEEHRHLYEARLTYARERATLEADHRRAMEALRQRFEAAEQAKAAAEREKQEEAEARAAAEREKQAEAKARAAAEQAKAAAEREKQEEAEARAAAEREKQEEMKARAAAEQAKAAAEAKALQMEEELLRLRSKLDLPTDGKAET